MAVSVVVPWRAGCPHREAAWQWVQTQYAERYPEWEIVTGSCADGPFNRAAAIVEGSRCASADTLVIADGDIWTDPAEAVVAAEQTGWAIPHRLVHRLSPESTEQVLAGHDWRGMRLSSDNPQDSRPYLGHETGTIVVMRRDVLDAVPPDVRFVGWGSEDDAWAVALRTLIGAPWQGKADVVHLWHPPQPRQSRIVGNPQSAALLRRYRRLRGQPEAMRSLVEEGRSHGDSHDPTQPSGYESAAAFSRCAE